ncbi:MAG: UDP-N-acetylglucosamine 2-epimerase (hydrolyzing) [Clostridiales bacterium]|nr:UDP-N-acetylglucosamine 2-epimerase (hydrolyzing) [Clostridiales bacterium]
MGKYKVAYATGSRADYGIVKNYLRLLDEDKDVDFSVLVTGSHLESKFGHSIDIIEQDGFKIELEVSLKIENTSNANIIHCMAMALDSFGNYFENYKFDLLIILGDRYEMMAVAIAAAMQRIPILHLHGGEVTYGNYDEFIRHSITKMSQYHFTSTEAYRKRVIQLGEDPARVFYLGALGAENCCKIDENRVVEKVKTLTPQKYWVVAFHPETLTNVKMEKQVEEVLAALDKNAAGYDVVFMGTNADTKSDVIRFSWRNYVESHKNAYYYENLNVDSFLYLVKNSIALIGNSSSGIIETPSLGRYTINIGDRQKGRVHGNSVINVTCDRNIISQAMKKIIDSRDKNEKIKNPYYKENTAENYYKKTKEILKKRTCILKEFYDLP